MAAYREVRQLSAADAAYLAGLIDGEGTVTLSRRHAGDMRQLVVSISNTELGILEFALVCVGAGKLTRKRTSKAHHTPSYSYAVGNRQALAHAGTDRAIGSSAWSDTSSPKSPCSDLRAAGRKKEPLQPSG